VLFVVGVAGTSSASAKPATVELTCARSTDAAADQLRALTLDQQRAYIATCGLPGSTHPGCFGLVLGSQPAGTKPCTSCHSQPGRVVLRA
jgi:hypothetical protein